MLKIIESSSKVEKISSRLLISFTKFENRNQNLFMLKIVLIEAKSLLKIYSSVDSNGKCKYSSTTQAYGFRQRGVHSCKQVEKFRFRRKQDEEWRNFYIYV